MSREELDRLVERFRTLAAQSRDARAASRDAVARSSDLVRRSLRNLGRIHLGPAPEEPEIVDRPTRTKTD